MDNTRNDQARLIERVVDVMSFVGKDAKVAFGPGQYEPGTRVLQQHVKNEIQSSQIIVSSGVAELCDRIFMNVVKIGDCVRRDLKPLHQIVS